MSPLNVVGLTGGIGAGKSAVSGCFTAFGVKVVDTDVISHQLTAPNGAAIGEIGARFGHDFLTPDGALNRQKMRQRVFSDGDAKAALEQILHPLIVKQVRAAIASHTADSSYSFGYVVLAIPLLFERMTFRGMLWRTLAIDCPETCQIERVRTRSGLSAEEVRRVIASQVPRALRLQLADDVISNAGDLQVLANAVSERHKHYDLACGRR